MLKSTVLRVGVQTLYNINVIQYNLSYYRFLPLPGYVPGASVFQNKICFFAFLGLVI